MSWSVWRASPSSSRTAPARPAPSPPRPTCPGGRLGRFASSTNTPLWPWQKISPIRSSKHSPSRPFEGDRRRRAYRWLRGEKLVGGGEPYPGLTGNEPQPSIPSTPQTGPTGGLSYVSEASANIACPDGLPSDAISYDPKSNSYTETRISCRSVSSPINPQMIIWTNSGQQLDYNGQTYVLKN